MTTTRGFYVDLDVVVDELRNAQGRLCVQGALRQQLEARNITSRVLVERGPGGGWPVVRFHGSRRALIAFIDEVYSSGDPIDAAFHAARIKARSAR